MEIGSDSEAKLRREFAAAAEVRLKAVRQFVLSRETWNREERYRLRPAIRQTKAKNEAIGMRLLADHSTL